MMRTAVAKLDIRTDGFKQAALSLNVAHIGNVLDDDGLFSEQRRCHCRQGGIFRAADSHSSDERVAAADNKLFHESEPSSGVKTCFYSPIAFVVVEIAC